MTPAIAFLLSLQLTRPWDHPRNDLVATLFATSGYSLARVEIPPTPLDYAGRTKWVEATPTHANPRD